MTAPPWWCSDVGWSRALTCRAIGGRRIPSGLWVMPNRWWSTVVVASSSSSSPTSRIAASNASGTLVPAASSRPATCSTPGADLGDVARREPDVRVRVDGEVVGRAQVVVALLVSGVDARRVDRQFDRTVVAVHGVRAREPREAAVCREQAPSVPGLEVDRGLRGIKLPPGGGPCRVDLHAHGVSSGTSFGFQACATGRVEAVERCGCSTRSTSRVARRSSSA